MGTISLLRSSHKPATDKPLRPELSRNSASGSCSSSCSKRHCAQVISSARIRRGQRPFPADSLNQALERVLKPLNQSLLLHSLRQTFATWRLEMGNPMVRVQALMGHADANTLLRYAHVQPDPLADLLLFLVS
jgi:integrase